MEIWRESFNFFKVFLKEGGLSLQLFFIRGFRFHCIWKRSQSGKITFALCALFFLLFLWMKISRVFIYICHQRRVNWQEITNSNTHHWFSGEKRYQDLSGCSLQCCSWWAAASSGEEATEHGNELWVVCLCVCTATHACLSKSCPQQQKALFIVFIARNFPVKSGRKSEQRHHLYIVTFLCNCIRWNPLF